MPRYYAAAAGACLALTAAGSARSALAFSSPAPPRRPDTSDYRSLLLHTTPLLDVRAPIEHLKGSFPTATNLPILTDTERAAVGTCYKTEGSDAAVVLGTQLVSGATKAARVASWIDFARRHPHGYLYCFRGGMRSQTAQRWMEEETGGEVRYPLVVGGAKAMRTFLLEELARNTEAAKTGFVTVRGATGSGKTKILDALGPKLSLDLEGLAQHRGSAFGTMPECPEQMSQIDFENGVSISLARLIDAHAHEGRGEGEGHRPPVRVYVEDESRRIGRVTVPPLLFDRMSDCAEYVTVTASIDERIDVIVEDYVFDLRRRFVALYGEEAGPAMHKEQLLGCLGRIRKKYFPGDRLAQLVEVMGRAFDEFEMTAGDGVGDTALHRVWIKALLEEYYDPMYQHQDEQQTGGRELFRGSREDLIAWALEEATVSN